MTTYKTRLITGMIAFAAATTGLTLGGGAAYADTCEDVPPVIDSVTVNPGTMLLTNNYAKAVTVTVEAHDEGGWDDCANDFNGGYSTAGIKGIDVDLNGESDFGFATTTVTQVSGDAYSGVWKATAALDHGDGIGLWSVAVDVEDFDYNDISDDHAAYFHIDHGTKITQFSAASDTVHKGDLIRLKGKFTRLEDFGYETAAATINYYFRRSGTHTWQSMGTSKSVDYNGKFAKQFTAKNSGTWAARFTGQGSYLASNAPTFTVKVLTNG
jgi:hypothetical protein